jgi:hypothetical protein
MPTRLDRFVHEQNVHEFERKLEGETDPAKRKLLEQLLARERAQLRPQPKDDAPSAD